MVRAVSIRNGAKREARLRSGHRFQTADPRPFLKAGMKPPVTCAYCGNHAGYPSHRP